MLVGFGKKSLDTFAIAAINRNSDAGRKRRLFLVLLHHGMNALNYAFGFFLFRFWQDESKFVAAVARGSIDGAAIDAQCVRDSANRTAANQMTIAVINFFQAIEVE